MRSVLVILLLGLGIAIAEAAPDVGTPTVNQKVRLAHPSVGCPSEQALISVSDALHQGGDAAMLKMMTEQECGFFETMQGEIAERGKQTVAICVLGLGNSRCLWFGYTAFKADDRPGYLTK